MREEEKNSGTEDLVDKNHREEAFQFGDVIWGGVDPVSDSRVAVGNGVEGEMTRDSEAESRYGASRNR